MPLKSLANLETSNFINHQTNNTCTEDKSQSNSENGNYIPNDYAFTINNFIRHSKSVSKFNFSSYRTKKSQILHKRINFGKFECAKSRLQLWNLNTKSIFDNNSKREKNCVHWKFLEMCNFSCVFSEDCVLSIIKKIYLSFCTPDIAKPSSND